MIKTQNMINFLNDKILETKIELSNCKCSDVNIPNIDYLETKLNNDVKYFEALKDNLIKTI